VFLPRSWYRVFGERQGFSSDELILTKRTISALTARAPPLPVSGANGRGLSLAFGNGPIDSGYDYVHLIENWEMPLISLHNRRAS
jgi:hypothetical protein